MLPPGNPSTWTRSTSNKQPPPPPPKPVVSTNPLISSNPVNIKELRCPRCNQVPQVPHFCPTKGAPVAEPSAPTPGLVLFNSEDQSDVVFLVGLEPDVWRFPAHSFILAAASPVFEDLCSMKHPVHGHVGVEGALDSSDDQRKRCLVLSIKDVRPDVFQSVQRYIYTKELALTSIAMALHVLQAASRFLLSDLISVCLSYLHQNITSATVIQVIQFLRLGIHVDGNFHEKDNLMNELMTKCLNLFDENASELMKSDEWDNLDYDTLCYLLQRDTLAVGSELEVYEALVRWTCQECKRRRMILTPENKRFVLGGALFAVRYFAMTQEDFLRGPATSGLLSPEERDLILAKINKKDEAIGIFLPEYLSDPKLCNNRCFLPPPPPVTTKSGKNSIPAGRNIIVEASSEKKKSVSKRFLHGIGDFIICVIQLLD